jgi:hypothetical protein
MIATIDTLTATSKAPRLDQIRQGWHCFYSDTNYLPYDIWIERNDPIGYAENHTEEAKSEKLDNKFVASFLQDVSINCVEQSKSHLWTEEVTREQIEEHANINVPAQYKAK